MNEFALMWNLKDSFPLHYIVFKQTAVHIPHEANVEQVFSTSGILSSPHMDPRHLARLTMIARNKKIYKPPVQKILSRYFQKFSKAGKLAWEESTLGVPEWRLWKRKRRSATRSDACQRYGCSWRA